MKIGSWLIQLSLKHPKRVIGLIVAATLALGVMASTVSVDTDPENMLAKDEPARIFHDRVKEQFSLYDMVVLGVVNEKHPDGVFNPETLNHVQELTNYILTLADPKDPTKHVIASDVYAPGVVDNIKQDGPGQIRFEWLMKEVPKSREGALAIRDAALSNPLFKGTMVSEDGKSIGIFAPVSSKNFAAQVRTALLEKIATQDNSNGDTYYITGLPVAEDAFGKDVLQEMFTSPPLAMLIIFLLMLLFFKKVKMVIASMLVAMFSVVCSVGLLNASGNTFHIMSSMIPIFLMPIAIVDSIHIFSEFIDVYPSIGDRRKTLEYVMAELFSAMLYTSLTSAAGFASLAFAPIPPIQVFGVFVAIGIMLAWLFTMTFIPAFIMLLKEETLADIGGTVTRFKNVVGLKAAPAKKTLMTRLLHRWGRIAFGYPKTIITVSVFLAAIAFFGITKLSQNDNPMNWFVKDHPIRVADRVLNSHLGGTYQLYLVLEGIESKMDLVAGIKQVEARLNGILEENKSDAGIRSEAFSLVGQQAKPGASFEEYLVRLIAEFKTRQENAADADYEVWASMLNGLQRLRDRDQVFNSPEMLRYIEKLQAHLQTEGGVGKSNSLADIVKKIHQELYEGSSQQFRIPEKENSVAECLVAYQNSHRPNDLWHFVTPDYKKTNIWIQLKDGDNQTAQAVVRAADRFIAVNPPPAQISHQWAGLNYINVIWQERMVTGMGESLLGSFVIVFLMMVVLFRSLLWGVLAMLPLTMTIGIIYGVIGWIGKDYDMPVAVLSSLTLGLAVDFAIHFLQRSREIYAKTESWPEYSSTMFEEPARAISRNIIVIAVGFSPLLISSLNPYRTTGILFATIMSVSGVCTLLLLPACLNLLKGVLFEENIVVEGVLEAKVAAERYPQDPE